MEKIMQKNLQESQAIIQIKTTYKKGDTQQLRINRFAKPIPNETIRNSRIF